MLVPQALMGVATVGLTYDLVRRPFGRGAGFAAGLVLALTPVTVALSRHNNPDALLVLCCTAALWCLVRGLQDGRTRWLVLSGVMVGLGFEAKMAAALMVVPGIAAAYVWIAPAGRARAVRQLLAGGAAMAAVGLAWPLLMWVTPAADRPWVAGTSDNSIWSLILGYNGLGRIFGQSGGPGGGLGGPGGGGFGGRGGQFGGQPGVLRLLNDSLGGQGGWLLGFAWVAGAVVLAVTRLRRADARTGWLIAVGGSFLVTAVAFSQAQGIFHPYYVSLLAPFTAALVGAGVGVIARGGLAMRVGAPLAITGGIATELAVLHANPGQLAWVTPLIVAVGVFVATVLAANVATARLRAVALAAVVGALLLAPGTWAFQTLGHPTNGTFPAGGPAPAGFDRGGPPMGGGGGGGGMFGGDSQSLGPAVSYVRAHGGGTIAVSSQTGAAGQLIATGADVAAIGGFSGRESQVSLAWLADAVQSGRLRWAVTSGGGGGGFRDSRVGAQEVMTAIGKVGTPVRSVSGLYDLKGTADALRALA
jgi:4-amino-4-deoxy-L-arabinose transferase-like glycosyltransferase